MKKAIIVSAIVEPKNKHNYTELKQTLEVLEVLKGLSKDYEIVASSEQSIEEVKPAVSSMAPFIKYSCCEGTFKYRLNRIEEHLEPVLAIDEDEKNRAIYSAHLIPAFHPADFLKRKDQILASLGVKKKPSKKNVSKGDPVFVDHFAKGLSDLLTLQGSKHDDFIEPLPESLEKLIDKTIFDIEKPINPDEDVCELFDRVVKMAGLHEQLAGKAFRFPQSPESFKDNLPKGLPEHIHFGRCIAEPLKKTKVEDILEQGADFFESRREEYGEEYLKTGKIRKAFFPNGIKLETESDFYYFHLFNMIATKLSRIAGHWGKGQHDDSWNDVMVYAAMALERVKNEK